MTRTNTSVATRLALVAMLLPLLMVAAPSTAEAKLAFFRNYPDLKWNVIKTEHFNVFYPESKDPNAEHYVNGDFTARKTAYVAEEMYPMICGQFNYYLDETVNIVMLDQTDSLTGYTVPNFDWIVVSGRHSDLLWRLRGHHDWLRAVMYHEFAHVVSLKADQVFAEESFGTFIAARWSDGRINTQASAQAFVTKGDPWWWVEGGGEYYPHVAGINTWTASRDMRMRMDVLEDQALNFDDMGDYMGSNGGFDGNRHYLSGYAFALYLEERFGQGIFQSFGVEREKQGWTPDFNTVLEDVLNIPADQLYEDWKVWMLAKYQAVADGIMEQPAIGVPLKPTLGYWQSDAPGDREQVAYKKGFKGWDRLQHRRDQEADGIYAWAGRYSPDGTKWGRNRLGRGVEVKLVGEEEYSAYNGGDFDHPGDKARSLYRKTFHKTLNLPLTGDGGFDWSPDGKKVVTVCPEDMITTTAGAKAPLFTESSIDSDGYNWHRLCVIDLEESEEMARQAMIDHFGEDPMEEDLERWEMQRRGVEPPKRKDSKNKKDKRRHWVDWLQSSDVVGSFEFLADSEGNPIQRVSYPAWSPDGKTLAYVFYDDGTQNLKVVDLETRVVKDLTTWTDGTRIEGLDWSPDGKQLVFDAWRFDQNDIYVIGADGTGARPITFDKFEDREPSWGHDGNIYFTSDRVGHIQNVFRVNPRLEAGRPDADLDGILDADDACPDEPETVNLFKDTDGCPDGVPVKVTADAIIIEEKVFFELDAATIKAESFELLDAVARVILGNPQIESIEIGGHTDSQGEADYNLDLSERRAIAVGAYLIKKGVQKDRLASKGYGMDVPLVEDETQEAFAANRRVEFKITAQRERTEVEVLASQGDDDGKGTSRAAPGITGDHVCVVGEEAERLDNAYLVQLTNVVSGAFFPYLTPGGHLMYDHYTPYGWKSYGLSCNDFHNQVVDDTTMVVSDEDVARFTTPSEVYPDYSAVTQVAAHHAAWPRNPVLIPILEIANVSLTHIGVNIGAQFGISDSFDTNSGNLFFQAGENLRLQGSYTNKSGWAEWYVGGMLSSIKFDYGFDSDEDGSSETTDDRFLGDIKQAYLYAGGYGGFTLPFNSLFRIDFTTFMYYVGIQGVTDGKKFRPLAFRGRQTLSVNLLSRGVSPGRARSTYIRANPRGGRAFNFRYSPNFTVSMNTATGGKQFDDGQEFGNFFYQEFYLTYTEYIALPFKLPSGGDLGHTLQVQADVGLIDRNVPFADEIRGGGRGSNRNFRNPFASNTLLTGYEPFSLAGETVALMQLAYRFPIARQIDKKIGPIYFESLHMQFFGTVGNFWSYKVKDGEDTVQLFGENVVTDAQGRQGGKIKTGGAVQREWPGMESSENGNYVLGDLGLELRLAANLFNRSQWLTSFSVAYGFNDTAGRGDQNNDGIFTNSSDPSIALRADEKEPAGFRFYINIGSGW